MLRFIDGFDHYTTITQKWTNISSGNVSISAAAARTGAAGLRFTNNNPGSNFFLTLDSQATWIAGAAFRLSAITSPACHIFVFRDGASYQCELRLNTDGTLSVTRNGTWLASSAQALLTNTFYFVEFKAVIANSGGRAVVRVNGDTWIDYTGDTQNTGNASANTFQLGGGNTTRTVNIDYDDIYLADGQAGQITDFIGDCKVETLLPSGAGATTQWTPSAGSNYECVDEADPNDDTDYVTTSDANDIDTYAMGNLATAAGTVKGVQPLIRVRMDDAGPHEVARVLRIGGTDYAGSGVGVTSSYVYVREVLETSPDTSSAFTISEVNSLEFGPKMVS